MVGRRRRRRCRSGGSAGLDVDSPATSIPSGPPRSARAASSFRALSRFGKDLHPVDAFLPLRLFGEDLHPVDAFRPLRLCEEEEEEDDQVAEPSSAQTLQEPDVSSLVKLLDATTLEESSITARSSAPGSNILFREPSDWYMTFHIRMDRGGSYHTYPHLGGPFQNLQEADNAIDRHLQDLRHPTMWKEQAGVSVMDKIIQKSLYWPDGTSRKYSRSRMIENTRKQKRYLVEALVDKYNEDHDLSGDLAYVLKDVLQYQSIFEDDQWYNHFNFTVTTEGPDCIDNLFFAEVLYMDVEDELVVSCLCRIESNANGDCHGCKNNGTVDMKHPGSKPCPYAGGHLDVSLPFEQPRVVLSHNYYDENLETEEAAIIREEDRLRHIFRGIDDQDYLDKIFKEVPPGVTMVDD